MSGPTPAEMAEALRRLVDDEPCTLDHDGDCQTHNAGQPCAVAVARDVLARYDNPMLYGTFDEVGHWEPRTFNAEDSKIDLGDLLGWFQYDPDPTALNRAVWLGRPS